MNLKFYEKDIRKTLLSALGAINENPRVKKGKSSVRKGLSIAWKGLLFTATNPVLVIVLVTLILVAILFGSVMLVQKDIKIAKFIEEKKVVDQTPSDGVVKQNSLDYYGNSIVNATEAFKTPLYVILGVWYVETSYRKEADASISVTGALGPMQMQPSTWTDEGSWYTIYKGKEAAAKRKELGVPSYGGKFEFVTDYQEFVKTKSKKDYEKVAMGAHGGVALDANLDGKADPKNFQDAVASAAFKLSMVSKNYKNYSGDKDIVYAAALYNYNAGGSASELKRVMDTFIAYKEKYGTIYTNVTISNSKDPKSAKILETAAPGLKSDALIYAFRALNIGKVKEKTFYDDFFQESKVKLPKIVSTAPGRPPSWFILSTPLTNPMKHAYEISSEWDPYRLHPIKHIIRLHDGVDLSYIGPIGLDVYAACDGKITKVFFPLNMKGRSDSDVSVIELTTLDGRIKFAYLHVDRAYFKVGDTVKMGQAIGREGNVGIGTGTHLHFRARIQLTEKEASQYGAKLEHYSKSKGLSVNPIYLIPSIKTDAKFNRAKNKQNYTIFDGEFGD